MFLKINKIMRISGNLKTFTHLVALLFYCDKCGKLFSSIAILEGMESVFTWGMKVFL